MLFVMYIEKQNNIPSPTTPLTQQQAPVDEFQFQPSAVVRLGDVPDNPFIDDVMTKS